MLSLYRQPWDARMSHRASRSKHLVHGRWTNQFFMQCYPVIPQLFFFFSQCKEISSLPVLPSLDADQPSRMFPDFPQASVVLARTSCLHLLWLFSKCIAPISSPERMRVESRTGKSVECLCILVPWDDFLGSGHFPSPPPPKILVESLKPSWPEKRTDFVWIGWAMDTKSETGILV